LLRILAGVQGFSEGELKIAGQPLGELDRAGRAQLRSQNLSYLGQRDGALEHLSLADYLDKTEVDLGSALDQRGKSPLSSFSGGERARIELTKIIAEARPLLLLDEPTSQMDERRTLESIGLLFTYLESGGAVVISTRNEYLIKAADQIIAL
jgi:ABC-type lipoprotein export system ATPase subunit